MKPVPPPEQPPGDGLRTELEKMHAGRNSWQAFAQENARAADRYAKEAEQLRADLARVTAERDEAQARAVDLAAGNVRLREVLEAIWSAIPGFNENDHPGLMTTHVDRQSWWETVVPLVSAALTEPRHDR